MKKTLLSLLLSFTTGFLVHALFFPDILANGIMDVKQIALPNPTSAAGQPNDPLITKVEFDGKRFSRHNITIGFTRYIQIINTSKTESMQLLGTTKELSTPRAYAESESIQAQFNKKGQYVVADKNNPAERMVITVK